MVLKHSRFLFDLTITIVSPNIAHHSLLSWTHSAVGVLHRCLSVEAHDLQFSKLDIEVGNKVLEDVAALRHQLSSLLIC